MGGESQEVHVELAALSRNTEVNKRANSGKSTGQTVDNPELASLAQVGLTRASAETLHPPSDPVFLKQKDEEKVRLSR